MGTYKLTAIVYLIAGIASLLTSGFGRNVIFIPIGCCFIILAMVYNAKAREGKK